MPITHRFSPASGASSGLWILLGALFGMMASGILPAAEKTAPPPFRYLRSATSEKRPEGGFVEYQFCADGRLLVYQSNTVNSESGNGTLAKDFVPRFAVEVWRWKLNGKGTLTRQRGDRSWTDTFRETPDGAVIGTESWKKVDRLEFFAELEKYRGTPTSGQAARAPFLPYHLLYGATTAGFTEYEYLPGGLLLEYDHLWDYSDSGSGVTEDSFAPRFAVRSMRWSMIEGVVRYQRADRTHPGPTQQGNGVSFHLMVFDQVPRLKFFQELDKYCERTQAGK